MDAGLVAKRSGLSAGFSTCGLAVQAVPCLTQEEWRGFVNAHSSRKPDDAPGFVAAETICGHIRGLCAFRIETAPSREVALDRFLVPGLGRRMMGRVLMEQVQALTRCFGCAATRAYLPQAESWEAEFLRRYAVSVAQARGDTACCPRFTLPDQRQV